MIVLFLLYSSIEANSFLLNSSNEDIGLEDAYGGRTPLFFNQRNYNSRERFGNDNDQLIDTGQRGSFLDRGASLSMHLRQMANIELGVTSLQDTFNTLPYMNFKKDEEDELTVMVHSLDKKLKMYSSLVEEMSDIVKSSYKKFKEEKLKSNREISSKNLILDFGHVSNGMKQHEYYPCCIIPDHYLVYNPHFGTNINTELWCDSGLEQENLNSQKEMFFTPLKLTEVFSENHHLYPNLKWQFFMSASGVHTEFPAHRSGTSVGSDCGRSSRHHHIYEKTIRPNGRNIVVLFDLGRTLRPRLLLTAKGIGHYVVDTLTHEDNVAMVGVATTVFYPTPLCMHTQLLSASHDVKQSLRHFIDYLEIEDAATNHTLGLERALELISGWSGGRSDRRVLVIYVTLGILGDLNEVEQTLRLTARKIQEIPTTVIISAFRLGASQNEPFFQSQFLEALTKQDYKKFNIKMRKSVYHGDLIAISTTLRVAPIIKNFYDVVESPSKPPRHHSISNVTVSDVYWDTQGNDMVLSLSQGVYGEEGEVIGVVGVDLALSFFLEDVTYYTSVDQGYAFVIDSRGNVLGHPKLGRPESWSLPLLSTPVTMIETSSSFLDFAPSILLLPSGHKRSKRNSKRDSREYWWKRSESLGWIFILSVPSLRQPMKVLSPNLSSLPSTALFHRLDLLSPQEAKICRHFNQMATLDGAALFLSAGAYQSPSTYLAKSFRHLNVDSNVMTFLMDQSKLLSNPGLREGVREEVSSLFHIAALWQDLFKESKLHKYIIRRYGASLGSATVMFPGTLMDAAFDARSQEWFIRALDNPGKVVVSPPFLDPGGSGLVVTVSHTVYQGRSATLHSSSDPVQAVLAADFTFGYWHKLLADIEPLCANSIYFKDLNHSEGDMGIGVRCFLMDMAGYLIAHPSFLDPTLMRHASNNLPRHITHQEPVLSMALLGKSIGSQPSSEPVLKKIWCSNYWKGSSERHYSFKLKVGQVIQSTETNKILKNEHMCLHYKLTAVPGSNLILGFINQTCPPATAFCPCSMVDRLCLNCQLMEGSACECPCECPLPSEPCFPRTLSPPSTRVQGTWHIPPQPLSNIGALKERTGEWRAASASCPRPTEPRGPLHYGVGMLSQLDVCLPMPCETHIGIHSCLGVLDCVWCVLDSDGATPLEVPHCTQAHNCYGGIRGGPSPYPPGLSPLPHSKERGSPLPVGPVAGGVLAVFLVMGLAIYFYRSYVGSTTARNYTSSSLQSQNHHSPLYPPDTYPELETGENDSLDDGIISASAAAAISPYRMNPSYRRPAGNLGEASDHGYSTMTPHDESENLAYTDLAASSLFPPSSAGVADDRSSGNHRWSFDESELAHRTRDGYSSHHPLQTRLSSPKRIGPNKVIVPVTVHMVDSV